MASWPSTHRARPPRGDVVVLCGHLTWPSPVQVVFDLIGLSQHDRVIGGRRRECAWPPFAAGAFVARSGLREVPLIEDAAASFPRACRCSIIAIPRHRRTAKPWRGKSTR